MKEINCKERNGYDVVHNSTEWCIGIHSYDENVNGVPAFQKWSIHPDSEEMFILLEGKGWLLTADGNENYTIAEISRERILLVETAERHCVLLTEGASALIVENKDVSNTVKVPVSENVRREILETLGL